MTTEQEVVEKAVEEEVETDIEKLLSEYPDAPSLGRIEEWKEAMGSVSLSAFSEEEVYIWRSIQRKEWLELQTSLTELENPTQADLEDKVISSCLLWVTPAGKAALKTKAGSAPSLNEQIMLGSNFLSPAAAGQLVIKL